MTAEVTTLYPSNYREIVPTLRVLADEIERGDHGKVSGGVVILSLPDEVTVFGMGEESSQAETVLLMTQGIQILATP